MAGTIRGKIDCISSETDANDRGADVWKAWYDHMENLVVAGVVNRIALQNGDGGTGFDHFDGGNPFGSGAFGVYEFPANGGRDQSFYVLGQYGEGTVTTDGAPILVNSNTASSGAGAVSFAFASALASDDTTPANPWQGGTAGAGADTKNASPVWDAPASGTMAIWPISNETGNTDGTVKQNTMSLTLATATGLDARYGIITDDDNFFMYIDEDDDLNISKYIWFGPHIWHTGISPTPLYNLTCIGSDQNVVPGNVFGDTAGISSQQSGLFSPAEDSMRAIGFGWDSYALSADAQPSNIRSALSSYEEYPISTHFQAAGLTKGSAGQLDSFIRITYGLRQYDARTDLSRICIGTNNTAHYNVTVPWDGSTTPGTTLSRDGVDF